MPKFSTTHCHAQTQCTRATHYMKQTYSCMFDDEAEMGEARKILWNVLEYLLGPLVHAIQSALSLFQ